MSEIDTSPEAVQMLSARLTNRPNVATEGKASAMLLALLTERARLRAEIDKANATANENAMTAVRMGEENNRLRAENAAMRKALTEIACYKDLAAWKQQRQHNSYSHFDEPNAVEVAHTTLIAYPERP